MLAQDERCFQSRRPVNEVRMYSLLLPLVAAGYLVRGSHNLQRQHDNSTAVQAPAFAGPCTKCQPANLCAGQDPIVPGTPECLPVVCSAVCECRIGLPDVPLPMPVAIVPLTPPTPQWNAEQTTKFCACVGMRLASDICSTDYCEDKLKEVMHIVQCPNGAEPPPA